MMPEPALSVTLQHQIHSRLQLDVSIEVGSELAVLTGASGAGKTTLLRLIAGLELPDQGTIRAYNVVLTDRTRRVHLKLRERRVGYVFQHDVLFPHLDVAGNLAYGLRSWSSSAIRTRVKAVTDLFGIGSLLHRRIATLSGGERQRVGVARAVAPRPRVLLCDEPVSALDLDARYLLLNRLKEVQRAESIPILLVTHAWDEALAFGDRLFVLDHGQVVAEGDPAQVFQNPPTRTVTDSTRWRNVFAGVVASRDPASRSTTILLTGGPTLVVSNVHQPIGAPVFVRVHSDEIVLARGPIGALSAQNLLAGTIERILVHDSGAEVAIRIHDLLWMVGITVATIASLDLKVGHEVKLILKARSCHPVAEPALRSVDQDV